MNTPAAGRDKTTLQLTERDRMFMNWKVPSRLTEDGLSSRAGSRLSKLEPVSPRIPSPASVQTMKAILPDVTERAPPTPAQFRKAAQSATPRMSITTPRPRDLPTPRSRDAPTPRLRDELTPRVTPTPNRLKTPQPIQGSQQPAPYRTKTYRTQELFRLNENVPQYSTLQDFLQTATPHDRRLIERTLKMIYNKNNTSNGAVNNVQRWLDTASDEDRKVALNFFSSIGMQMMGSASPQERQTVQKVIGLLKDHTGRNPYTLRRSRTDVGQTDKGSSRQYVRLLSPNTRASRWQHQTWHHLPVYKDNDAVYNKSAVYTEPGKVPFRHWNIHPDWELKQQS